MKLYSSLVLSYITIAYWIKFKKKRQKKKESYKQCIYKMTPNSKAPGGEEDRLGIIALFFRLGSTNTWNGQRRPLTENLKWTKTNWWEWMKGNSYPELISGTFICFCLPNLCIFAHFPTMNLYASRGLGLLGSLPSHTQCISLFFQAYSYKLLNLFPFSLHPLVLSMSFSVFLGYPRSFPVDFPVFLPSSISS